MNVLRLTGGLAVTGERVCVTSRDFWLLNQLQKANLARWKSAGAARHGERFAPDWASCVVALD